MKLRNKKTGEIKEWECVAAIIYGEMNEVYDSAEYDSLAKLYEEWEDYKPPEPYIKDKKVRKFVRDWAEINGIETVLVCQTFNAWGFKNKESGKAGDKEYMLADILFKGEKPEELEFGKEYTITELCGEEQE